MVGPGLKDFPGHAKFIAKAETLLGYLRVVGCPRHKNYTLGRIILLSLEKNIPMLIDTQK